MAEDWNAVAKAIDGRLRELPITTRELGQRADLGPSTIRELRYNVAVRKRHPSTLKRLSAALEWPPDELEKVLHGDSTTTDASVGEPAVSNALVHRRLDDIESTLLEVLAAVRDLAGPGDRDAGR